MQKNTWTGAGPPRRELPAMVQLVQWLIRPWLLYYYFAQMNSLLDYSVPFSTILYSNMLYYNNDTLLYYTRLHYRPFLFYSILIYFIIIIIFYSIVLYSNILCVLYSVYSAILHSTLQYHFILFSFQFFLFYHILETNNAFSATLLLKSLLCRVGTCMHAQHSKSVIRISFLFTKARYQQNAASIWPVCFIVFILRLARAYLLI